MKTQYCDFVTMILDKSVEMFVTLQGVKTNSNLDPV